MTSYWCKCFFYLLTCFRMLSSKCSTKEFRAPETFTESRWRAEPADIWSCGVVLVELLTGHRPWKEATSDQWDYTSWVEGDSDVSPWIIRIERVNILVISLLKEVLVPIPSQRLKIDEILNHNWVKNNTPSSSTRKRTDSGFGEPELGANSELWDTEKEANSKFGDMDFLKLQGVLKKTPVNHFRTLNPSDEKMRII